MDINEAYLKVSDKEILRSMVALYGFEAVQSALFEVCRLTQRALDACPRCDGERYIWQADLSSRDLCYACKGTGKRK